MLFVKTDDGVELYVERRGEGVPCLYLHGGPGYWSKSFSELAGPYLEKQVEMIYLDQRGCGRFSQSSQNYSLERLMKDIEEVRRQLEIDEMYILAHSFGGILAVHYAHHFGENVLGLILTNGTLHMRESLQYQYKKGVEMLDSEVPEEGDFMGQFPSVQR
jgi:proline iminopeptidase